MTQRILLYSPDLIGHPRIYCRVFSDILREKNCHVYVAMGFSKEHPLETCDDLLPLLDMPNVEILDLRTFSTENDSNLKANEIIRLQYSLNIDTTIFIEADKSKDEFHKIANGNAEALIGKNIGIFANSAEWIPGENFYTGLPIKIIAPTIRTTLGNIKRALFNRKQTAHYFFEKLIIGKKVLQEIWVKDERVSEKISDPVYWMPEISRPFYDDSDTADDYDIKREELSLFLSDNAGLEPALFFGDAAYYKGYDLFLCAIHPGRTYDSQQLSFFQHDVERIRALLKKQGRLYETNEYVHSQRLKQLYFSTINIYLTTHRLALSSSTVIQAAELGKPMLVPDRGLLGHRVKDNNIGLVYEYENVDDLSEKVKIMLNSSLDYFSQNSRLFWRPFSEENIARFVLERTIDDKG